MSENPFKKQFVRLASAVQDLDMLQMYRNKTTNPIAVRYLNFLERIEDDLGIDSPFEYAVINEEVSVAIKRGFTDLSPDNSVFVFDSNFNLVEDPNKIEDKFFVREDGIGGDISVKPIIP